MGSTIRSSVGAKTNTRNSLVVATVIAALSSTTARAAPPTPTPAPAPPATSSSTTTSSTSSTTGYLVPGEAPPSTASSSSSTAVARPRLAVAGFVAPDLPPELVAALESACANEAARLVNADVISAEDMRMMMNVSVYQATMGCESGDCLQSLSNVLAVQQVVSGAVRRSGEQFVVSLVRLDAVNARALQRTTVEVKSQSDLLRAVRKATPALFGVIGKLEVWDQPTGAELFIDGGRVGTTPMAIIDVKTPGQHTVEIVGPTVTPWKADFELGAGDEIKLRAKNRPIDQVELESAAWTWTGMGLGIGGAAAAATAGGLYFLAIRNDQRADSVTLRSASQEELNSIADVTLGYTVGAIALGSVGVVAVAGGVGALLLNPAQAELGRALE